MAAGFYDGFFEPGLQPWDVAAGSLMITEAGGLVGNFTGEADYLHQREVVAGNPRIYAQLVQTLAPYSRVIAEREAPKPDAETQAGPATARPAARGTSSQDDAAEAPASGAGAEAAAPRKPPRRITKAQMQSGAQGDDAPF